MENGLDDFHKVKNYVQIIFLESHYFNITFESQSKNFVPMIDNALKFLRDYLNKEISGLANNVVIGNIAKQEDITPDSLHLSLVHIEEEKVLREVEHRKRVNPTDNFYSVFNPLLKLNLYILVSYQYTKKGVYDECLKNLSKVAIAFQNKYVFQKSDFPNGNESLEQLVVELYTQTLEQNNNMWQAIGEKLAPSLLYKVRVVAIAADKAISTTEEVKAIGLNVLHKQ